jgi:hypothetical protein
MWLGLFHTNLQVGLSLAATNHCNKTRSFHTNLPHYSNCDFGSPCDCIECREATKKLVCEICRVRPSTDQSSELHYDRKGIRGYTFTSFCDPCWKKHLEEGRKRKREEEETLALHTEKVEQMMEYVRGLDSTEQVPIAYAVERLMSEIRSVRRFCNSRRWHQRDLVNHLSQDLEIVKVRNRYVCNKRRVDAIDFKLWYFHRWPGSMFNSLDRLNIDTSKWRKSRD